MAMFLGKILVTRALEANVCRFSQMSGNICLSHTGRCFNEQNSGLKRSVRLFHYSRCKKVVKTEGKVE